MLHDHACIGATATYCVAIVIPLFLSTLAFGVFVAQHAADALWGWVVRIWAGAGRVQEERTVQL